MIVLQNLKSLFHYLLTSSISVHNINAKDFAFFCLFFRNLLAPYLIVVEFHYDIL